MCTRLDQSPQTLPAIVWWCMFLWQHCVYSLVWTSCHWGLSTAQREFLEAGLSRLPVVTQWFNSNPGENILTNEHTEFLYGKKCSIWALVLHFFFTSVTTSGRRKNICISWWSQTPILPGNSYVSWTFLVQPHPFPLVMNCSAPVSIM